MPIPAAVLALVERFRDNRDAYRSGAYNETQLRREFLDPFFKALGWDVDNTSDHAEAYKDVVHEDALKVGGSTKAPDYSFRVGGRRVFFLEAKKPSVNIRDDVAPAYQLRRYAWSANLPLSVVSDFEEFAVYDCRIKPASGDKTAKGRLLYLTFEEYEKRWDEIAAVFSKEAVLKGGFDRYARQTLGKRGTTGVDSDFLAQMEGWRDLLAKNIALRNHGLAVEQLNHAVQATIDRIVFLRICEDRGIEPFNRLQGLSNGPGVYPRLVQQFRAADDRYNSGLFHFGTEKDRPGSPDDFTPGLVIDDKPLKEIIAALYYPQSPYEFSVLPADILGQVYERFLGKVIRLTASGQARVEEKPEVKKAGGVFYTPTWVVDYIVAETLGRLVLGKTPKQVEKVRVLDPACGSGSFLLGAYQWLLDWHLAWYVANDPVKHAKGSQARVYALGDAWRLTAAERKRILLNNIYGVDIDLQAVEVTKLSLLLKVLEGETEETLNAQMRLFHERALPDLDGNIQCGNSLVGPDFFESRLELDGEERRRINAFDWGTGFPEARAAGGFDAVIGNPPYVRQETLGDLKGYLQSHYHAYDGVADLYVYFMEQGIRLLKPGGRYGIIVSNSFLRATYARPLRRVLKETAGIERIVDFGGLPVFANAKDTYVCIPLLVRGPQPKRVEVGRVEKLEFEKLDTVLADKLYTVPHERLDDDSWPLISDREQAVFAKVMAAGKPLGDYVERKLFYGVKTGLNEAFELTPEQRTLLVGRSTKAAALIKRFVGGQDIRHYRLEDRERYLIVLPCGWTKAQRESRADASERAAWRWLEENYPTIAAHLGVFADALKRRQDQGDYWWELRPCDYYAALDAPKIIFPDICKSPRFHYDETGTYLSNTAYCLGTDDLYLLAILNSRLFWFAIGHISIPFGVRAGEYRYRLIYQYMERVPIVAADLVSKSGRDQHDQLAGLARRLLALHRDLGSAAGMERTRVEREIAALSDQTDRAVYALYGLTADEIAIVSKTGGLKQGETDAND